MYESHFGLKKRPFRALALGNDVFIGPQTATILAGVKKALTATDGVIAVSGSAGSGKTTLVGRALEGIGAKHVTVTVGRVKLSHDEVLELLLEELGVDELPAGTVQRFSLFRHMLKDLADDDTRVIVVVEDAGRIGTNSLAELEALTASDAGVSDGAAVVLMGGTDIDELLESPRLARLKQRLRLRQSITPFSANELLAYFKHSFRQAGGEFDNAFELGTSELIHSLSNGVPRMANNIVQSAMMTAAEENQSPVTAMHINNVAAAEYGLMTSPKREDSIPQPIQDTLPDLEDPAPQLAGKPAEVPEWEREPTLAQLRPDLEALEHAMAATRGTEPQAGATPKAGAGPDIEPGDATPAAKIPELVPEITLDQAIQSKISKDADEIRKSEAEAAAKAEADEESEKSIDIADTGEFHVEDLPPLPNAQPAPKAGSKKTKGPALQPVAETPAADTDDPETGEIAEDHSRAQSIDDVDEKMAETLFGEELGAIAAQIGGKAAAESPANDELNSEDDAPAAEPAPVANLEGAAEVGVKPAISPTPPSGIHQDSASQRLATVRSLNGTPNVMPPPPASAESIVMADNSMTSQPPATSDRPQSIEDQINTSITQTMKTLKISGDIDDDDDMEKGGLFGRFRKP